jgi:hypothetical protein
MTQNRILAAKGDHPAVKDPRVHLTCACCIRRDLTPIVEALHRGRHGTAKNLLAKLWLELDKQIETAVAADRCGAVQ